MLPWDDWIYHVDDLRNEANNLHNQSIPIQDAIRTKIVQ